MNLFERIVLDAGLFMVLLGLLSYVATYVIDKIIDVAIVMRYRKEVLEIDTQTEEIDTRGI